MNRLELRPHTGRYEAGAVLPCVVHRHDAAYDLTTLSFAGGELELPRIEAPVGERVRVRIRARDVALASERPGAMSTRNVLAGRVAAMTEETGPVIDVAIAVGEVRLIARITRRSRDELGLAIGAPAWALVKSVSLDRRSAGYG
jgi:molybdate transport system ATP-binding protein